MIARFAGDASSLFGGTTDHGVATFDDSNTSYDNFESLELVADSNFSLDAMLKKVCNQNNKNYKKFKTWCDKYFFLPHRKEARGIGGIFFDYETKNWIKNFKFIRELGLSFIEITKKIIKKKEKVKWTKKDKEKQFFKRGRYVEFNLLYDRGTRFGLNSGGNIDSILMSLPPEAKWK